MNHNFNKKLKMSDFELPPTQKKSKVAEMSKETETTKVKDAKAAEPGDVKDGQEDPETPKYNPEELLRIFDEMLFSGSYTETVTIRGRLKVAFTTRSAEQMDSITQKIDSTTAVLMATLVEKRNLLNLYHGLVSYQGTDLRTLRYEDKVSFINKLPAPIVGMLMVALFDFDNKVNAATKEAEANF